MNFYLSHDQAQYLAEVHGTPLYLYSKSSIAAQADQALAFQAPFGLTVRYAMKANPHPEIIELLTKKGIQIDASSGYEAREALALGIAGNQILLTSQECPDFLQELVDAGVQFNACSLHQLERYAKLERRPSAVSIRINPGVGSGQFPGVNVGGAESSFGIWHRKIEELQKKLEEYGIDVTRVHTHIGSGSDPEVWRGTAELSTQLLNHFPHANTLNLGGGFKVARVPSENAADLQKISASVAETLVNFHAKTGRKIHLEIEPGTFLVANAGLILGKVIDIVETDSEHHFIKLNTGMDHIIRPALYGVKHPFFLMSANVEQRAKRKSHLVGHCCESTDRLTLEPIEFPEVKIGELIVIGGTGAYCASMATHGYNSFPKAGEIFTD